MNRRSKQVEKTYSRRQALSVLAAGCSVVMSAGCGPGKAVRSPVDDVRSVVGGKLFGSNLPGKIAYVQGTEIWQWAKGSTRRLADGQAFADPCWSPDGTRLAAVVQGTNQSDLVVLNSDGTVLRQLTHDVSTVAVQDSVWVRRPAWSPDGKRLAFITDRGNHDMSLWLINAAGGEPVALIVEKPYSGGLDWPTWSPRGNEIAYTTFITGASQIHSYDLGTQAARVLAKDPDGDFDPAWSPRGGFVAYAGRTGDHDDILVVPEAGTGAVRLTESGLNRAPVWSPDGDAIAYLGYQGQGFDLFVTRLSVGRTVSVSSTTKLTDGLGAAAESGLSWTRSEE